MTWIVIDTGDERHVLPKEDLKEHCVEGGCWCEWKTDSEDSTIIIHKRTQND